MSHDTLRQLAAKMVELENEKADHEEQLKGINRDLDDLRLKKIPELMESLGVKNVTFEGLGRVQTAPDIYASTREGQKQSGIQWLRDCGYEDMISEGYNASSVKALFRRMLKAGEPIPDDIFNVTPFVRASIVKK